MHAHEARLRRLESAAPARGQVLTRKEAYQMTDTDAAALLARHGLPSPAEIRAMDADALDATMDRAGAVIACEDAGVFAHVIWRFMSERQLHEMCGNDLGVYVFDEDGYEAGRVFQDGRVYEFYNRNPKLAGLSRSELRAYLDAKVPKFLDKDGTQFFGTRAECEAFLNAKKARGEWAPLPLVYA